MSALSVISPELRRCAFVAVAGMLSVLAVKAKAQQPTYFDTPGVTVDLSVLDDGGYGAKNSNTGTGDVLKLPSASIGTRLALPSLKMPVSRLHVPAPAIKLRPLKKASRKVTRKAGKNTKTVKMPTMPAPAKAPGRPSASVAAVPPPVSSSTPPAPPPMAPQPGKNAARQVALEKPEAKPSEPAPIKAPVAPPPVAKPKSAPPEKHARAPVAPRVAAVKAPTPPRVDKVEAPVATASKPEKPAADKQLASLPSAAALLKSGHAYRIIFAPGESKLPGKQKKGLRLLAEKVKNDDSMRLQLHAYAGNASLSSSKARRLSLSRALSVRSYLIESGVRSTRIDVRALGNKTKEKPLNRVDINVVKR